MKTHQLSVQEPEDNYQIIAIYTDEQDYRLAFILNKHLNLQLVKSASIIDQTKKTDFTVFEYEDTTLFRNWLLLNNHCFVDSKIKTTDSFSLFNDRPSIYQQKTYYLKKYKKANFLLKVIADEDVEYTQKLIETLHQIPQIYATEILLLDKIQNKKLLIF
ncbi:MAG TPA: IPExxxVDY family protein [Lutibacter sp.]|nr:IPExxxVDY family protein [Lutibacter sp.]